MALLHMHNEKAMKHKIHEDLLSLITPINTIKLLPINPRHGDVDAVAASYDRFGQTKPVVVVEDTDGGLTVIAGNTSLKGAIKLGWTHIAATRVPFDDSKAAAYALADNRTSELGTIDTNIVYEMLEQHFEEYGDVFEALAWDEYEMAAMEPVLNPEPSPANVGWQPPELISEDDEQLHFTGDKDMEKDLVTSGSTAAGLSGSKRHLVQYTLVFESQNHQARWYDFIRWLKARSDDYPGNTTGAQLVAYLEKEIFGGNSRTD